VPPDRGAADRVSQARRGLGPSNDAEGAARSLPQRSLPFLELDDDVRLALRPRAHRVVNSTDHDDSPRRRPSASTSTIVTSWVSLALVRFDVLFAGSVSRVSDVLRVR